MKRFYFTIFIFLIIAFNCRRALSPEEQIKNQIEQMVEFANKRQIGKLMDSVSPEYKDGYGNRRDSIKAILIQNLMFRKNVRILLKGLDVKIENSIGHVTLSVFVKEGEGILPDNADIIKIELRLVNVDDKWLVISAVWKGHQSPF